MWMGNIYFLDLSLLFPLGAYLNFVAGFFSSLFFSFPLVFVSFLSGRVFWRLPAFFRFCSVAFLSTCNTSNLYIFDDSMDASAFILNDHMHFHSGNHSENL